VRFGGVGKLKRLVILAVVICVAGAILLSVLGGVPTRVDTSFATSASMRDHYDGKTIDAVVTDAKALQSLKSVLAGYAYSGLDHPACMFDDSISVTLTNGRRSMTFCPAFCGDPLVEINGTGKYLHMSDKQRKALDGICKRYGVVFPG
jgi:hypothetical protein